MCREYSLLSEECSNSSLSRFAESHFQPHGLLPEERLCSTSSRSAESTHPDCSVYRLRSVHARSRRVWRTASLSHAEVAVVIFNCFHKYFVAMGAGSNLVTDAILRSVVVVVVGGGGGGGGGIHCSRANIFEISLVSPSDAESIKTSSSAAVASLLSCLFF